MKRTGFKRRVRADGPTAPREVKPWADTLLAATLKPLRRGTYAGGTSGDKVGKEKMLQHAGYMNAVRDLGYCMLCRSACRPQFCHRDHGKGTGIKTDVREGWPGCNVCHWLVGTSGQYPKEERRALELDLGRRTRCAVEAAGTWPKRLPKWEDR